ncbi:MAG: Rossmann-like and DUF2520 domain-containing protein [Thermoanaerobaculia bacterium]
MTPEPGNRTLGLIGGGRAAWAYGSSWQRAGRRLSGAWVRNESTSRLPELLRVPRRTLAELASESDLLLIAVSDRAIETVAASIPKTGSIVFHASGAVGSVRGGFSLHPLKALPPVGEESDLTNTLLVFEGNHREIAESIARTLRARFAEVSANNKPLYHAGAVFGANYVAVMLDIAETLMAEAGVRDVRDDLMALAESALRNWRNYHGPQRFTGPAARGDEEVVGRHSRALARDPQLAELYGLLADYIRRRKVAGSE